VRGSRNVAFSVFAHASRSVLVGGRRRGERVDQLAAVDQRGRQHRDRDAGDEHRAEHEQRAQVRAKAHEQVGDARLAAALLRPRGGEEADREHRLDHRHRELADQRNQVDRHHHDGNRSRAGRATAAARARTAPTRSRATRRRFAPHARCRRRRVACPSR
jgi:hypothetical protein